MEIVNNPPQQYFDQLQKLLNEEIKGSGVIGIVDLGSNLECWQCVAMEGNHPIGAATVRYCNNELFKLYVAPQYRRKNVAERLVKHVMKTLKEEGQEDMFIEMTNYSLPFWEKFVVNNKLKFKEVPYQPKLEISLE